MSYVPALLSMISEAKSELGRYGYLVILREEIDDDGPFFYVETWDEDPAVLVRQDSVRGLAAVANLLEGIAEKERRLRPRVLSRSEKFLKKL